MKAFDQYSIRGFLFSFLGIAGIAYEIFSPGSEEVFVILLYGFVVFLGLWLIFFKTYAKG